MITHFKYGSVYMSIPNFLTMCFSPSSPVATISSFIVLLFLDEASLVAQTVKHLPAMRETWVQSLGWEDPLEKEMATHSSILAWRIPWTEETGGLQSVGSQRVRQTE